MRVVIARRYNFSETQGLWMVLEDNSVLFQCVTLELAKIKIPYSVNAKKVDCIPEGIYPAKKFYSPTKGQVFLLSGIPGRDAVEVHSGNFVNGVKVDTQGCILPGTHFEDRNGDGFIDVINSGASMRALLELLPEEFNIHIL